MKCRGQILVIVAVLLVVALLLLAVVVDAGRLYIERARLKRAAQAAADAGIGVAAEHMVTLAVARQTQVAMSSTASPPLTATPTPPLSEIAAWLTDEDRQHLIGPAIQSTVVTEAQWLALANGLESNETHIDYPHQYEPAGSHLRIRVITGQRFEVLLAGLLDSDLVRLQVEAVSQIPQD
jgi:Tfp pilus assembly protein PilX